MVKRKAAFGPRRRYCRTAIRSLRSATIEYDEYLELRDLSSGRLLRTLGTREQEGSQVVVADDGRRLFTGSWQHGIQEWKPRGHARARSLCEDDCTVREFHADAAGVIGLSSREETPLRVWDLRTGQCLREIPALSDWDARVRVSPDGRMAASCENEFVLRTWDCEPGGSRIATRRLTGHQSVINGLAITPDGNTVVSGSWDRTIRVWESAAGNSRILHGHDDHVNFVTASADGKIGMSWAADHTLRVWDLAAACQLKSLEANTEYVDSLCMTADGAQAASGDRSGRIKLWDVEHGQLNQEHRCHNWFVYSLCLLSGATVLASCSADATVGIWDFSNGGHNGIHQASDYNDDKVQSIVPLARGFASAGQDGNIRIWDETKHECLAVMEHCGCNIVYLATIDNGSLLVSANDNGPEVYIWDVTKRRRIQSLAIHENGVEAITVSPTGRTLVACAEKIMQLWDLHAARPLQTTAIGSYVRAVKFTPRGDRVVTDRPGENEIALWEPRRGERVWSIPGYLSALNPNGDNLIVAAENGMYLADLASGMAIRQFHGHESRLSQCQVTPDGRWLISAGDDRTIRVWNLDTAECVAMEVLES